MINRFLNAAEAGRVWGVLVEALHPFADLWLAETLSSLAEARAVAAATARTGKPLWLAFTLQDERGETPRLRSGETAAEAARLAEALGAEAILFNCSQPEAMAPAIRAARAGCALPVGVYANAFAPQGEAAANEVIHGLRDDLDPAGYLSWARLWVEAGASIVGGCCGIGAAHVARLASDLRGAREAANRGA